MFLNKQKLSLMKKEFLKNLPSAPGVYKMLDESKTILYIGKAGNLKKRVSSYLQNLINLLKHKGWFITLEILTIRLLQMNKMHYC